LGDFVMSLTKLGGILVIVGGMLMVGGYVGFVVVFLPFGLFADSPQMQSTVSEILNVLGFASFRAGPSLIILGIALAIIGWLRQRQKRVTDSAKN
jgi:hypothetical protein